MLNFDFLEKGLGIVSAPHFVYVFLRKMFLMLHSLLTDQILLSDCLYFLRSWVICVRQLSVNQAVTSGILKLAFFF